MRIFYCLLLIIGLSVVGCKKGNQADFAIPVETAFDIPVGLNTLETHFFLTPNIPSFSDIAANSNGVNIQEVTSIRPQAARLTIDGGLDMNFIHSIVVNLYDIEGERTEVFFMENIQLGNKTEIDIFPSLPEVGELIKQEFINVEIGLRFRQFPQVNMKGRLEMQFSAFTE